MPKKGEIKRVAVICAVCGKHEMVIPARATNYKTCSRACMGVMAKARLAQNVTATCQVCGSSYPTKSCDLSRRKTCSKQCLAILKKQQMAGAGNHQYGRRGAERGRAYKCGKFISHYGYVLVLVDGHYCFEHRVIMEKHIGRKLEHHEAVHHINENRQDNRIENLQLMTKAEHTALHNRLNPMPKNLTTGRFMHKFEAVQSCSQ